VILYNCSNKNHVTAATECDSFIVIRGEYDAITPQFTDGIFTSLNIKELLLFDNSKLKTIDVTITDRLSLPKYTSINMINTTYRLLEGRGEGQAM
jgi:hypothetical protein